MHEHEVNNDNEKKTLAVIILTVVTMFAEIIYGYITNSMSLLADGYHMGTHVIAFLLAYIAYILIRKLKDSERFPNGTDKIGVLTAYTSALFLGITGIGIIIEALQRLFNPMPIRFDEAIIVAVIGLTVNILCMFVMDNPFSHGHCDESEHEIHEHCEDYNFKSAYYHILADILTSVSAIIALIIGKYFNIIYSDPLIGILGGILILKWAFGLAVKTVKILVDADK